MVIEQKLRMLVVVAATTAATVLWDASASIVSEICGEVFIFHQDNAPAHCAQDFQTPGMRLTGLHFTRPLAQIWTWLITKYYGEKCISGLPSTWWINELNLCLSKTVSSKASSMMHWWVAQMFLCTYWELATFLFLAQPKCTEVPNYPHNYHVIPIFVHHIGLPLAIHWQHSFVQNTAKVCSTSYTHRWVSAWQHLCVEDVCSLTILYKKIWCCWDPHNATTRRTAVRG